MSWLVGLALKNLRRNLRRTVISSIAVVAGVALTILGYGLIGGLDEGIIRAQIDSQTGHVSVRPPGIEHAGVTHPIDELIAVPEEVERLLAAHVYAQRLHFDARVIAGSDSVQGIGVGFEPDRDPRVFSRDSQDFVGQWSTAKGIEGLVLGKGIAEMLDVDLEDLVTLETRTASGAINAMAWPVVGVVHAHNPAVDNHTVFVAMEQAQRLVAAGGPSQIAIRLADRGGSDALAEELNRGLPEGWTAQSYTVPTEDLLEINKVREKALKLMIFVILAIAATGIANTIIMSVYERIREVGTLAAMGMPPHMIRALFVIEGAIMGFLAALLGAGIGAKINHYFATHGFDVGNLPDASSRVPFSTTIYTAFSTPMIFAAMLFGVTVAVLASLWPARFASRLDPAVAVRED